MWFAWLVPAALVTAKYLWWEIEYFRSPGPIFEIALLCLLPVFLVLCALYVRLRPARLWQWEIPSLAALVCLSAVISQPKAALVCGLLFVACLAGGSRLARWLAVPLETNLATLTLGFGLGIAALIPVLFALGLAHAYYPAVFLILLALPCLLFRREARAGLKAAWKLVVESGRSPALKHSLAGLAFIFVAVATVCGIGVALSPSIAFDPLDMHLASTRTYASEHALRPLPSSDYSYYPQGAEIVMAAAYSLGGQAAAQMISPLFWVLLLLLLFAIARSCGLNRAATMVGVAGVVLIPVAHWTGSNANTDSLLYFFQAAALYSFIRWLDDRAQGWILSGALFLGSTFAIKHVALFGAIPLLCFFIYALRRVERPMRAALLFCLLLAASGLYWPVRTFVLTGNPVFPGAMSQSIRSASSKQTRSALGRIPRLWLVPWRAHFEGPRAFESPLPNPIGLILFVFLPLSITVVSVRSAARRACLLFSLAYLLYWMLIIGAVRYAILPISLLTIVLLGKVVEFYDGVEHRAVRISLASAFTSVMLLGALGIAIIEVNAPELLLFAGRIDSQTYLRRALATYGSMAWLQQSHVQANIFALNTCSRAYAPDPARFYCASGSGKEVARYVERDGCQYLVLRRNENIDDDLSGLATPSSARLAYRDAFFSVYQLTDKP